MPNLPERARQMVMSMVDIILYCNVEMAVGRDGKPVTRRVMHTKPSEDYKAGDRTGRLPKMLPLDYDALVAAFEGTSDEEASAPPAKPEGPRLATEEQVSEYEELTSALSIAPEVLSRRLEKYGAKEPRGVGREEMDQILTKLHAAKEVETGAAAAAPQSREV